MSGIQPTGEIHLGNYLGAIINWVELSKLVNPTNKMIISIVDLHALTIPPNPETLSDNCFKMITTILGCGINPSNTLLYYQSHIKEHSELMWLLSCHSSIGYLMRMPQFREKIKNNNNINDIANNLGLFSYPVLQSSDILLYESNIVPVGEDQAIHLNFTRDLVDHINTYYNNNIFIKPETLLTKECCKVMSLRNPINKMSKSEKSDMSRINLIDDSQLIIKKIKKSVTDSLGSHINYDKQNRAGLSNLIGIYAALSNKSINEVVLEYQNKNTSYFKKECGELIESCVGEIRENIFRFRNEKNYIDELIKKNADEAREIACKTIDKVKKAFGFVV